MCFLTAGEEKKLRTFNIYIYFLQYSISMFKGTPASVDRSIYVSVICFLEAVNTNITPPPHIAGKHILHIYAHVLTRSDGAGKQTRKNDCTDRKKLVKIGNFNESLLTRWSESHTYIIEMSTIYKFHSTPSKNIIEISIFFSNSAWRPYTV